MTDAPRFTINRSLVILRHRQPFLDWLMSADPNPPKHLTLADLEEDSDAFLIPGEPTVANQAEAVKWVEKRWSVLFEHVLSDWLTDEELWPQNRTLKLFRQWFTVEYRSMVWDLSNDPLEIEEWIDAAGPGEVIH